MIDHHGTQKSCCLMLRTKERGGANIGSSEVIHIDCGQVLSVGYFEGCSGCLAITEICSDLQLRNSGGNMKNPTGSLRMTILLLCLLAGLPGLSLAQDRGGITGTVSDPSGAGIPDASVKVTNIGRGEAIELRSTTVGLYSASNLIPGIYAVTVTVPGFRTSTLTGIE